MEYFPYEGAGFLLSFNDFVILGQRIKKAEDLAKDPVTELEYMGGKIDPQDGNDPYKTASAELAEELGADILEKDWATSKRLNIVHMFQPFSKKWIWCFVLISPPRNLLVCEKHVANLMIGHGTSWFHLKTSPDALHWPENPSKDLYLSVSPTLLDIWSCFVIFLIKTMEIV